MIEIITGSSFWAIALTLGAFVAGQYCQRRWKLAVLNPILLSAVFIGALLTLLGIPVEQYQAGCALLSYLLTPATICLAISCYTQLHKLKKHMRAVLAGILGGTLAGLCFIWAAALLFGLPQPLLISLLPKSVTTAIGVPLSEQSGGIGAVTTVAIIITGVFGNACGPAMCRLFGIRAAVAQGVAYGTAAHAVGTAKAHECGTLTGAVSSFSLTVAGLITALFLSVIFA